MSRWQIAIIAFACSLSLGALKSSAQTQVSTGTPPLGTFVGGPDVINLGNLNVHLSIPIVNKAGRGLPFVYNLTYDNSIWYPVTSSGTSSWQPSSNWGWGSESSGTTGYLSFTQYELFCYDSTGQPIGTHEFTSNWVYIDSGGTPHAFSGITELTSVFGTGTCSDTNVAGFTSTATDGSGLQLAVSNYGSTATVTTADGEVITPPFNPVGAGTVTDRNGNQISVSSSEVFTDTLGTTALTVSGSGTPTSPVTYTYTGPGGSATYTVNYTAYTVKTNFGCGSVAEFGPTTENLVSSIELPDYSTNSSDEYTFTYEKTPGYSSDVTGRIASVTLPTGGTISYTYFGANGGVSCSDGSAVGLTRTTPDGKWTYSRTAGSGTAWTTTVTDPSSAANQTAIQFQEADNNFYETESQAYDGSSTGGTLLKEVDTCYNDTAPPCTGTQIVLPILQRTVYTKLPDGSTTLESEQNFDYTNIGLPTEVDDYGYGSGSPGTLLRKLLIQYASLSNNIMDKPSSVTVEDASGNITSQTTYAYDGASLTSTTGTPQLVALPSSQSRGNATTVSSLVSGSTDLTKKFTYFDTGNVDASKDVNGAQTSYTYADCGNSFPTTITYPLSLTESLAWDCNGGVVTSETDANGNTTSVSYSTNNPYFWRVTNVSYPGGGWKLDAYPSLTETDTFTGITDTSPSTGCSSCREDETLLDGLGRTSESTLVSDPDGETTVTTTYDSNGRVYQVTNPDRSGAPTNGTTTTTYDALNRPVAVTQPDGNVQHIYYGSDVSGNGGNASQLCSAGTYGYGYPVLTIDASGAKREIWTDALGRTIEVDEPNSSGTLDEATCSQFDADGNLTEVVSPSSQTRTYAYDDLGRLTSATTPESGTTSYTYDANGNLATRTDALNLTATYAYDQLHRLASVSYSNTTLMPDTCTDSNNNPAHVCYYYGQSSYNGLSIVNGKGRRTGMEDVSGETAWSYDPMGRIASEEKTIAGVTKSIGYAYNLDGSLSSLTYPDGHVVNYVTSNAERPTLASDPSGGTTPPTPGDGSIAFSGSEQDKQFSGTPGTGSTNITGSEQSKTIAATAGETSISFSGSEQSKSVPTTPATGSVTVSGSERTTVVYVPCIIDNRHESCPKVVYDAGTATITVNGHADSASYGENYTSSTVASALASAINGDSGAYVTASASSATVELTAKQDGPSSDYSLSASSTTTNSDFTGTSFPVSTSGSTLTGGADSTVYNSGTATVTVNGHADSTSYGQNSTTSSIASALASAINGDGSAPVTASVSGSTLSLKAKSGGTASNYSFSVSIGYNSTDFSSPSFSASATSGSLTGGTNAKTIYDSGTVTITVNGHGDSASYGQSSTTSSIASALASAINGDGSASVTASASGSTLDLTAKTNGTNTDYSFSVSATYDTTDFSSPSFGASPASGSLTGGTGASTTYDSGTVTVTINGHADSASYGQGSTASTIASGLASAINGDSSAYVNASASSGTLTLASKTTGSSTDYAFSVSITYDTADFSSPSFSASPTSGSLSGGSNGVTSSFDYASGAVYAPQGTPSSLVLGKSSSFAGITETWAYDDVLEPTSIAASSSAGTVLSLTYGYSSNGNVTAMNDALDTNRNESMTYDPLNRLLTAQTAATSGQDCWGLDFGYDPLANLLSMSPSKCSGPNLSASANANNQLTGYSYNADGDMTADGSYTYTYDAENQITSAAGVTYTYDGDGMRVEKSSGVLYWRAYTGQVLEETDASGNMTRDYIFFAGRRIAWRDASGYIHYYFQDALGSTRVVTDGTGNTCFSADYYPFGQEIDHDTSCTPEYKFAGYEFDSETGNYYDYARYYNPLIGRFMSPDPLGGDILNPQSLNRYSYVANDPEDSTDPLGLFNIPTWDQLMGESVSLDGLGGGLGCTADGVVTSCGTVGDILASGGGMQCPGNVCGEGTAAPFQCAADVCGYMTTEFLNTHENDWNGVLYTNAEFRKLEGDPIAEAKAALQDYLCSALNLDSKKCGALGASLIYVGTTGGNPNFSYAGPFARRVESLFPGCMGGGEGPECRTGSMPSAHWHASTLLGYPLLHLDHANPYWGYGLGFFVHFMVDMIIGNINPSVPFGT